MDAQTSRSYLALLIILLTKPRAGMPPAHRKEFCSYLNAAIREDNPAVVKHAATFCRGLNELLVVRRTTASPPFPPGGRTHRGGALPDAHRSFFIADKKFRVPGALATSFSEDKVGILVLLQME